MVSIEWKQLLRSSSVGKTRWLKRRWANMLFEKEMHVNRRTGFTPGHSGNLERKACQDIQ